MFLSIWVLLSQFATQCFAGGSIDNCYPVYSVVRSRPQIIFTVGCWIGWLVVADRHDLGENHHFFINKGNTYHFLTGIQLSFTYSIFNKPRENWWKSYCVVVEFPYSAADMLIVNHIDDCRNLLNPAWGIIPWLVSGLCLWDYMPFLSRVPLFINIYIYVYI